MILLVSVYYDKKTRKEHFCDELRAYVSEYHHFPNKHTRLLNKIKFVRWKINQGTLEEWKLKMVLDIAEMRDQSGYVGGVETKDALDMVEMRDMNGHTRGRKKKQKDQ